MMLMGLGLVVIAIIVSTALRLLQSVTMPPVGDRAQPQPRHAAPTPEVDAADVRRALMENLAQAQHSGDPLWVYDATAALMDYLPTTLALHARTHGDASTPELEAALANILRIATARQTRPDTEAWQIQQRFLQARADEAGSETPDAVSNPLKLK
ncbi:hypothetical protein MF271_16680 [Deinococcus sp. KNUC1210]|uniref:hypothetical protein n=1 Tax=Deinococcus sp. KNUC1210 TaxID=2917691 RepID=UPI001EF0D3E6|nr:hypothetical protein [Deinococcus sp. KNUC1210]ULH15524.1 hypothetical protein MF271_16680 [Deinococcus sp. KNUC1210]